MKPNILFITTDQQRFDHIGIAGLTGIKTPNLDRLGSEGVHMQRAYCPSPICTPTRLSLLTGLYPSVHGGYSIGVTPDPFPSKTIPAALSSAGYRTGIIGKTHFVARPDEELHMAGNEKVAPEFFDSWDGPYEGFDYIQASTGHTINHIPSMHYRRHLEKSGVDYEKWFPQMSPGYDHDVCGVWNIPEQYHDTTWVTERTKEYISESVDQPWFCWASYQDPHEPFVCPEPWFSSVDTDNMPEYEFLRDGELEDKPDIYRRLYENDQDGISDQFGIPCVGHIERHQKDSKLAMQATLGMIAFLDFKIGELIEHLEQSGQLENTIIIFTSDHGEMHGHHGFWGKGLTAYEDCQRVPLLIFGPSFFSRSGKQQALTNLVDLPATFLGIAGINDYPHIQGINLLPFLKGEVDQTQDAVVVECRANQNYVNQITLITETHKLVLTQPFAGGELYDLKKDPDQYDNLWEQDEMQSVKLSLMERLIRKRMNAEPKFSTRKSFG